MFPIVPHFASECLEELKYSEELSWPLIEKKYLIQKNVNIVVQINGKKRAMIETTKGINENSLIEEIKKNIQLAKYLEKTTINKTIFIKDKLINLIVQ